MTVALPPFGLLVGDHGDELLRHARRLAGDDAEDVLQDALVRALRAYPRLTHTAHLRAWLHRVLTTTAFDWLDRRRVRAGELLTDTPPEALASPELYDDAFEVLIGALPGGAQFALRLRFVDDLPYETIAVRLDCSPEAARQRVSSAVRTLREAHA